MAAILIVYASIDGHTRKICERLQRTIEVHRHTVSLVPIGAAGGADLASFDKIVVGASIRYGRHSPRVRAFVDAQQPLLDSKPNAFFSVNIVARKPNKNRPDTNPYLQKFLRHVRWRPKLLEVFAGKLDYPRYGAIDRLMIRLIMWITDGPTDVTAVVEFTDWQRVDAFAERVVGL
jgi:menaquinone-dependent protoporphyrinogen oxidase